MGKMTLRAWRLAKEISQENMASLCGVHVNTYIAWEKEPGKIPVGKAMLMSEILGVDFDLISFCEEVNKM